MEQPGPRRTDSALERVKLLTLWDAVRSSYWFIPSLLCMAAIAAAFVLTRIDISFAQTGRTIFPWLDAGQPESARALLTTVASSMISVATLTFSVTIVTLTLATSSFGSRIVYSFMRDRSNQFVLGVFAGTFVYCLIVLRSVRSEDGATFVPHVSVAFALVLAVLGIGVLIYFIHHVAEAIQANHVVAHVSTDLRALIASYLPDADDDEEAPIERDEVNAFERRITASRGGTLQAVDCAALVRVATELDTRFVLQRRAGDHVIEGETLALHGASELDDDQLAAVRSAFVLGRRRTLVQDVEFGFHQLVEIAVRALSPGVNDPFTAVACIDELGAGLALAMRRGAPRRRACGDDGALRVVRDEPDFDGFVRSSFDQIRQHGAGDVAVLIRLLEVIERIAPFARYRSHLDSLRDQLDQAAELFGDRAFAQADRGDFEASRNAATEALDRRAASLSG